ncbi:hypothetical protein ACTFIU_007072 [Dictyostelium citrinum]
MDPTSEETKSQTLPQDISNNNNNIIIEKEEKEIIENTNNNNIKTTTTTNTITNNETINVQIENIPQPTIVQKEQPIEIIPEKDLKDINNNNNNNININNNDNNDNNNNNNNNTTTTIKDNKDEIFDKILSIIKENNSNLLSQFLENLSGLKNEKIIENSDEDGEEQEKEKEKQHQKKSQRYSQENLNLYLERVKEINENNKYFNFKEILNKTIESTGKTLLYTSIESDCFNDIVLLLLKYGADPNKTVTLNENIDEINSKKDEHSSNNNNNNNNNNSNNEIEELFEYYKKSTKIESPIHLVIRNGDSTILNLLLDYNVDVNQKDSLDRTPIILSSANGKTECSRLLVLKGCKVNEIDKKQKTALHLAMDGGYDDIATTLTQNGADISLRYHYKPLNRHNHTYRQSIQDYSDYRDIKILNKLDRFGNIQDGYNNSNLQNKNNNDNNNDSNNNSLNNNNNNDLNNNNNSKQDEEINEPPSPPIAPVPRKYTRRSTINSGLTSNISVVKNKKEIEKELERSIKWNGMIKRYNVNQKFTSKFKSRSIKGIPDRMRSEVWPLLSHAQEEKSKNPGLFNQLVNQHSANEIYIDLDVNRAYRNHIFFRERYGMGQVSLFNVLKVYSLYDQGVGYTQGMSSIASLLVMYLSEEDAFWTLQSLMSRPEYSMRSMFLSGLPGLIRMSFVFENLLNHYFPAAKKALDDINLTTTLYSTKWFLIGFLDSFPFHISLRVWDLIFSEGYTIVYSIAMALFRLNEKSILANKDSFEKCYNILRSFETFEIDEDIFIKYVIKHRISPKRIQFWEDKHAASLSTN